MSMTIEQAKSELMQIYGMLSPDKQRAIDTLVKIEPCDKCVYSTKNGECQYDDIAETIPTEQEPKTGHWMHDGSHWKNRFICSECNNKLYDEPTNYCPYCGCHMVEQERSDKE